ncbi:MAG: hypothetical protein C0504_16450 [Candidatus Solibacter sp.]|nr:hypothetical protein [Candidatus Solibacter sp.]
MPPSSAPLLFIAALLPLAADPPPRPKPSIDAVPSIGEAPSIDEVMDKYEAADLARRKAMPAYTSIREYSVVNTRFRVKASMKVQVDADALGRKRFTALSASGPGAVRKLVFRRMLDTEAQASSPEGQKATRICRDNYSFSFVETATLDGRESYVLEATPKSANPLLFRGRVWIDAARWVVVRIDGKPARNPSFWVSRTGFVHQYSEVEGHWLPLLNQSDSDIKVFGRSTTRIVYGGYEFAAPAPAEPGPGPATPP